MAGWPTNYGCLWHARTKVEHPRYDQAQMNELLVQGQVQIQKPERAEANRIMAAPIDGE